MADCAYIRTWLGKQVDLLQTVPNISDLFQNVFFYHFIPALVGKPISDLKCALLILPVHLGGVILGHLLILNLLLCIVHQ